MVISFFRHWRFFRPNGHIFLPSPRLIVQKEKNTLTFEIPVSHLLSKCGIFSSFHLAQGFLLTFLWSKTDVPWNPLSIWTFNFMISWGMLSNKVIDVSAGWILRVLNVSSLLLVCYNKRRWLQSRMTSLQAIYCFSYGEPLTIPSDRSGMVSICFAFLP